MKKKENFSEKCVDVVDRFDYKYGDSFFFQTIRDIKKDNLGVISSGIDTNSIFSECDYCTMFMTF